MTTNNLKNHLFHFKEMSFCGYSGSGKTTLITKLISKLHQQFSIGFIKHDAHKFSIDHPGKDTFKARAAGASKVLVNDATHGALIDYQPLGPLKKLDFIDCDFVFIEGYKESNAPKIIVVDKKLEILEKINCWTNVIALVGPSKIHDTYLDLDLPYFNRDDISGLKNFILNRWQKTLNNPLCGLVLAGGRSSRMKKDKGALNYHGISQTKYLFNILDKVCDRTFISCRDEQKNLEHIKDLPYLADKIIGVGPMGGIISAQMEHPNASWLVVAVDMPFINDKTIQTMFQNRDPFKIASAFFNTEKNWPEPLCTIYEPKARYRLHQFLALGYTCPRKILMNSNIKLIRSNQQQYLTNVNTPNEYLQAKGGLHEN